MVSKQREMRLVQLTRGEMATLPADTAVYEGVGKMFVLFSIFAVLAAGVLLIDLSQVRWAARPGAAGQAGRADEGDGERGRGPREEVALPGDDGQE
jgi:hypothetical protein